MKQTKDTQTDKRFVQIITTPAKKLTLLFTLLALCFGVLIALLLKPLSVSTLYMLRSFFAILFGSIFLYLALTYIKKTAFFFLGIVFLLNAGLFVCIDFNLIPFTFFQTWPLILVFSGIGLLISNFYKKERITKRFLVPSVLLFLLGFAFLLFSLKLFDFTFAQFIVQWWPTLILVTVLILLLLFFVNRRKVPEE